jgi:hypothetical protein
MEMLRATPRPSSSASLPTRDGSGSVDFARFNTAFCDSGEALRALTAQGLAANCRVLTASPFLQTALGARAEFLRDRLAPATLGQIQAARPELQWRALSGARAMPAIHDYGEVAALTLLTALDLVVLAATLTEADCTEPRLIIRAGTGNTYADRVYNGPWDSLLPGNTQAHVTEVAVKADDFDPASWGAPRGLLDRIRVASLKRAAYRIVASLGWVWPSWSGREAIVLAENELLQETAFSLALRGWSVRQLRVSSKPVELDATERDALENLCRDVMQPYVERWVVEPVRERLIARLNERLQSAAKTHKAAGLDFERKLASLPPGPSRVLLANFPAKPAILGAWHVARRHGVPLVGFQHGVSSEICATQDATIMTKEVMCSERCYTFNERASVVANEIVGRHGLSVPVGMPGDMRRLGAASRQFRERLAPIAFVSTAVYSGYWGRLWYGTRNDGGMLEFEMQMIRDVFAGLSHKVLYKRYPSMRLLDSDPAAVAAEAVPNIRVYSEFVDLRYLIGGCDVLVTARATSTVSWCLMSGKPVVFVDLHDDMRLRDDARQEFERGLFLYSTARPGWQAELRAFLDQPITQIEAQWVAKADARRDLIVRFFDMGGPAGARAARDIAAFVARQTAVVPERQAATAP